MTRLARLTRGVLRLLTALVALAALLVGVPWGLVTFIGWPLPEHIPTRDEVEATLLNPLSVTLLLDILACIAWPTWAVFVFDVARCVPDALRGVHTPAIGPVHAVASVLVAFAVLGVLQPRAPAATAGPLPSASPASAVMTTQVDAVRTSDDQIAQRATTGPERSHDTSTVVVRRPQGGIHDSLWRIAERELGDGQRWHELYQLNRGRTQADGHALTNPHLIRPGWVLRLPDDAVVKPAPPEHAPPQSPPPRPPTVQPAPDAAPDHHDAPAPGAVRTTSGTAITLWSGGLVAAALASAVALAMVVRRRKRLRVYKPGSGDRTPPPAPAPAVHALRLAYDEVHLDEDHGDEAEPISRGDESQPHESTTNTAERGGIDGATVAVGVRDERARALDLAAVRGLGLTGPGAEATARSLLVHLLGTTPATAIIPANDARALLGAELPASARLHVTDDLSDAITTLEKRCSSDASGHQDTALHAVLVAQIDRPHAQLQSLLDTGTEHGVAGLLLGHWPAGATVRVRADGIVAAASPSLDDLRGSCLFHLLDTTDTRDLLALLAEVPAPGSPPPADSTPEPDLNENPCPTDEPEETPEPDLADEQEDSLSASVAEPELSAKSTEDDEDPYAEETQSPIIGSTIKDSAIENTAMLHSGDEQAPAGTTVAEAADVPTLVGTTQRARQHPERTWELAVFGPVTLTWHSLDGHAHDVTSVLAPKHKALLVFLALHPSGTTREAVREALWPDARGRRPFNAFYASLSQLRKAFSHATNDQAVDLISQHDEQVALDPSVVEVDYWHLHEAEHERHTAATDHDRMAAWSRIAAVYRGEVADGMSALWLEGPREAAHRSVVDALAGMAAHYCGHDPQRQLQLLEHARLLNPENEDIYRDIMRVQAQLGFTDAISRTVQLLTITLAEIGERPDLNTLTLARALQARQHRVAS